MKAAVLQIVSTPQLADNLAVAQQLLVQAADAGAELAALPEYFAAMGMHDQDKLQWGEAPGQGPVQDFLREQAKALGLWIVGGTLPLRTPDPQRVRNACLVYNPQGALVARYDKMHLFQFAQGQEAYDETRTLEAGTQPGHFVLNARNGAAYRVGLSVCYDLRFPELYRLLACDLLLVPSAFSYTTGQAHWEVLLRARAIENQAYVLAAAQGGMHANGRRTWGHSMVVDPWGGVLAQQAEGPGLVLAEILSERLRQVRQQLPALQGRVL